MKSYQIHKKEAGSKLKNQKRESASDKKSKSIFINHLNIISHE